jgi:hypothetical protein
MNKQSILFRTLHRALSYKRPHNTDMTDRFTFWLTEQLPAHADWYFDTVGNLHVDMRSDYAHTTLFTAHVDTVHRVEGKNHIRMTDTHWHASGDVLGADDGAGVAMLMHLLCGGVPAYYLFTQGEECGGIGASHVADQYEYLLMQFDRAIAFDRRGIDSVITHQGRGRCCSDAFGNALAIALGAHNDNLMHLTDDTGIYTDTAEFIEVIPECTNISVGYAKEHTQDESLDLVYFQQLADAVLLVEWDKLPTERDPSVIESKWGNYDWTESYGYGYTTFARMPDQATINNPLVDYRREELYDALIDAQYGCYKLLTTLIAEAVYPDDPHMAMTHIKQRYICPDMIEHAIRVIDEYDVDTILFDLFDAAYAM